MKGRIAPKKPDNEAMEEDKDDGGVPKRPIKADEVAVGIDGDIERQFKMLGFADQSSVPRH